MKYTPILQILTGIQLFVSGGGLCVWVEFCELYQEQDILVNHVGILTHEKISYLQ